MGKVTVTCIRIAEFILPWVISALCIWCVLRLPRENGVKLFYAGPEYIFIIVQQLTLFVYFYKMFYPEYMEIHNYLQKWYRTHLVVWDRLDHYLENEKVS